MYLAECLVKGDMAENADQRVYEAVESGASKLDLSGLRLEAAPPAITRLPTLQYLDLSRNKLSVVPKSVLALRQLKILNIANNLLTSLPADLAGLQSLEILNLSGNSIREVAVEMAHLKELKQLNLQSNRLETLPMATLRLRSLTNLNLSMNQITGSEARGPLAARSSSGIIHLDLSNNLLAELPRCISDLVNLNFLALRDNLLTSLPASVGKLRALAQLIISKNRLDSLPGEIGKLSRLEDLSLGGNRLASLPTSFSSLRRLRQLSLRNNLLEQIPSPVYALRNLEELSVLGNRISQIGDEIAQLSALKGFDIADNELTTLPNGLKELNDLERIFLHGNLLLRLPPPLLGPRFDNLKSGQKPASPQKIFAFYFHGSQQRKGNQAMATSKTTTPLHQTKNITVRNLQAYLNSKVNIFKLVDPKFHKLLAPLMFSLILERSDKIYFTKALGSDLDFRATRIKEVFSHFREEYSIVLANLPRISQHGEDVYHGILSDWYSTIDAAEYICLPNQRRANWDRATRIGAELGLAIVGENNSQMPQHFSDDLIDEAKFGNLCAGYLSTEIFHGLELRLRSLGISPDDFQLSRAEPTGDQASPASSSSSLKEKKEPDLSSILSPTPPQELFPAVQPPPTGPGSTVLPGSLADSHPRESPGYIDPLDVLRQAQTQTHEVAKRPSPAEAPVASAPIASTQPAAPAPPASQIASASSQLPPSMPGTPTSSGEAAEAGSVSIEENDTSLLIVTPDRTVALEKVARRDLALLPDHQLELEEMRFMTLMKNSVSLTGEEKQNIIAAMAQMSQYQIDTFIQILEEEQRKFALLDEKHQPQMDSLRSKHDAEWERITEEMWHSQLSADTSAARDE